VVFALTATQDLFFEFPWNNFLHSAVYDLVHQVLTGHVDSGLNRELAIALFRDARLMHRIVDGQKQNDVEWYIPLFFFVLALLSDAMY
jgi:serine/threonine-protein phosphatase 6 regulatory subunit 3